MNANSYGLILCILGPLSLFLISGLAHHRLKLATIRASKRLWLVFTIKSLLAYGLYKFDLFYFYPLTWVYPMYLIKVYPREQKWWGLCLMCGVCSLFMPNEEWALALNILPFGIGPSYLKKHTQSGFVDRFYYKLCLGVYLLIYTSFFWISYGHIWLGAAVELIWGMVFAVFIAMKFMQERENEFDISLDRFRRDKGDMMTTQSHLAELGLISRGMIHEIANPLTILGVKVHLLKRQGPHIEDFQTQMEVMENNIGRIRRIIEGMRLFYRSDVNHYEEFDLKEVISNVLLFCGQRFQNHGVSIRTYGLDESIIINSRKLQLEQALLQLMNNAFDAIEFLPQKWIEISARRVGSKVEIFIKDSGEGISEDIALKMMDPFYSTKPHGQGTGSGLAFTQGLLQKNGGDLHYVKASHTLFKVELPLHYSSRLH
ncbi:MAG TPA: HAMP domain-containing sensor histidine kinase [Bacteriovoracaceae bacterium]|nr:HAMP domain-containing sensor histidine kinase [Bacteriovoracaceae bacterium]